MLGLHASHFLVQGVEVLFTEACPAVERGIRLWSEVPGSTSGDQYVARTLFCATVHKWPGALIVLGNTILPTAQRVLPPALMKGKAAKAHSGCKFFQLHIDRGGIFIE